MGNAFSIGIHQGILLIGVFLLTWLAFWAKKIFFKKIHHRHIDSFKLEVLEKICTFILSFIGLMMGLQVLGIDIVPLLTVSGVGAAALAFASRDVFANFFGGLMVYITRPFVVKDFIELPGKKISGTVEEIGWYLTSIRDAQKRTLYIPNALFSTEYLINTSRITHRFIDEKLRFRIADGDRAHWIVEKIREMVKQHSEIDQGQPIDVFLLHLGSWGSEIELKAYTKTEKYSKFMDIKQDILIKAYRIITENVPDHAGEVRT